MRFRVALAVFFAGACLAQDAARMDQLAQSYVTDHKFMGTALVSRGNQVLFSKGYGFADLEWNAPNTPTTKFRLGSVTKQFTAASILLLEERGKLNVDDPIKKYLPDAPAAWDKVTIFNVLTHTAGIPNFTSFPDYRKLKPFPTSPEQLVARFRDQPLDFEPGTKWSYSNSGYALLGYLIEKITGDKYETFVRDNIFAPLKMMDSGYDSNSAIIPQRASGYVVGKNGYENAAFLDMTIPFAAGALYSTAEDLLKWEQGLFGGKVITPASLDKMTKPFLNDYAFGLQVSTSGGHKVISHGGGIDGFATELEYYPAEKLTVVVLENVTGAASPEEMGRKLASIALGESVKLTSERKEITLDASVLDRYTGAYQMPQGPAMLISLDGHQLMGKLGNQQALPMFAESENRFFLKAVDAQIDFSPAGGKATELTLHQNGRDVTAKRMDEAAAKQVSDAATAFAKRFKDQTAAPGSEAAVRRMIEELRTGKPNYELMSNGLAAATRQQLPHLREMIAGMGALQSVTFKGVGPGGADIFAARFEKGSLDYRVWLAPDGKVESANVRPSE